MSKQPMASGETNILYRNHIWKWKSSTYTSMVMKYTFREIIAWLMAIFRSPPIISLLSPYFPLYIACLSAFFFSSRSLISSTRPCHGGEVQFKQYNSNYGDAKTHGKNACLDLQNEYAVGYQAHAHGFSSPNRSCNSGFRIKTSFWKAFALKNGQQHMGGTLG